MVDELTQALAAKTVALEKTRLSVLRLKEVIRRTGLGRSTIYSMEDFPRSIRLSDRAVGWLESEIEDWIRQRVDRSRDRGR